MSVLIVSNPEVKYWIIGGRRFLVSPHPHGDDFICEVCKESNYFSGHATVEGIEKDLTEHRCEDQKDLGLGVAVYDRRGLGYRRAVSRVRMHG